MDHTSAAMDRGEVDVAGGDVASGKTPSPAAALTSNAGVPDITRFTADLTDQANPPAVQADLTQAQTLTR